MRPARPRADALPYRPDIDGLRGLAVGLVVAYHAFPNFRTGGFIGVDVFFVISGYLITQLVLSELQAQTFSLPEFYRRRVRRIVPALLVVMTVCCIVGWCLLLPSELEWLGKSISWSAPFLANFYFATTGGYFERVAELNPLLHLWSLGVEEQFYIAWPILLILAVRHGVTLRVLAAVIAASLALSIYSAWYGPSPHFFNPATRAWELAVGGMLGAWQLMAMRRPAADVASGRLRRFGVQVMSLAGLTLIVVGGVTWTSDQPIPGIWSVMPTSGAALLIGAGPHAPANRWFLATRPMVFAGRISYPLYLWHWPLFSFTRIVLGHPPPPVLASAEIFMAVLAAYATYRLVEAPIRYGAWGRKTAPVLLTGLAAMALTGAALDAHRITGRLSGTIFSQWNQAVTDWHYPGENDFEGSSGFATLTVSSRRDRKALFIGDSHIEQYWPRVQRIIDTHPESSRSAVFATYRACPPLPGIESARRGTKCSRYFDFAMQRAFRADVDTVVFGAFWERYFLGEYALQHSPQRINGVQARTGPPLQLGSAATRVAFEQFQDTVSKLIASGRRVYIVLSNPSSPQFEPAFPPRLRLSLHPPRSLSADDAPRIDARPFESYVAPLTSRLRDIAVHTGATAMDPRLALCDGMICPATDSNGMPLYVDSNHLNGANARERATFFDEMLLGPDARSGASASLIGSRAPPFKQ